MPQRTDTKTRIGRAALALFVERGIAETSIRDITAAVGITEGALYRHYRSKEELAWALYGESFEAFAEDLIRVRAGEAGFAAELTAMVRTFFRFFDNDPDLFSYLLLAQHSEAKKVTSEMKSPVAVLRHCVMDGQARGEVAPRATRNCSPRCCSAWCCRPRSRRSTASSMGIWATGRTTWRPPACGPPGSE